MGVGLWILVSPLLERYSTCPKCGRPNSPASNYCNVCGALIRPEYVLKICPNCKGKISILARFCPECGQKQCSLKNDRA